MLRAEAEQRDVADVGVGAELNRKSRDHSVHSNKSLYSLREQMDTWLQ